MNDLVILLAALTLLTIAFGLGWETSARIHIHRYRRLNERLERTRIELERLSDDYNADPTRAAMNVGQEYVITAIEGVCAMLRHELDRPTDG